MLRGDEVGVLLADHLMRRGVTGLYATTIVSSSLLRALCAARGLPYDETLTGFKWIVRAGGGPQPLVFGYEEALGYCVAPGARAGQGRHHRRADRRRAGRRPQGARAARSPTGWTSWPPSSACTHTDQLSVRVDDLRRDRRGDGPDPGRPPRPPCSAQPVTERDGPAPRTADVVILRTDAARVVIRPSGTEPKLKAYLEVVEPVADGDVAGGPAARRRPRSPPCAPRSPPPWASERPRAGGTFRPGVGAAPGR